MCVIPKERQKIGFLAENTPLMAACEKKEDATVQHVHFFRECSLEGPRWFVERRCRPRIIEFPFFLSDSVSFQLRGNSGCGTNWLKLTSTNLLGAVRPAHKCMHIHGWRQAHTSTVHVRVCSIILCLQFVPLPWTQFFRCTMQISRKSTRAIVPPQRVFSQAPEKSVHCTWLFKILSFRCSTDVPSVFLKYYLRSIFEGNGISIRQITYLCQCSIRSYYYRV